jgi:hypothetical protein
MGTPKQEFYDPADKSDLSLPYISDDSGHHFFLRANIVIVFFIFVLTIVLVIGGYLLLRSKQNNLNKKNDNKAVQLSPSPSPTCRPRPACLDIEPRCLIAETADMCSPSPSPTPEIQYCGTTRTCSQGYSCECTGLIVPGQPTPNPETSCFCLLDKIDFSPSPKPVFCTMEAKECPDGSFVGRQGPNCDFASCPTPN